jgi:hypothetical protein
MGIDNHRKQIQVYRLHNNLDKFLFSAKVLEFIEDSGEIKRLIL